ncbi:uncharacterized protein B0T15DRAFT_245627 [Chaetomium strumarium]|uniref:Uncharacterized protein n=1 Tax=Chaetomium strumarium TaxID=1170767 RepID=A0AAJ0GR12_9PEZI|nr:hypothetical protein B0T15DRAFT_245627 [Chaetomium strumarium]
MATSVLYRSSLPDYTPRDVELDRLDSTTSPSPSILSAPPAYDDAAPSPGSFHPTVALQIETRGKSWCSLPLPLRPDPIPIFTLETDQRIPTFTSFRPNRGSGSCYLLPSSDPPASSSSGTLPVLSTTTYRFGPSRPPCVRLFSPHSYSGRPGGGIPRSVLDELLFPSSSSSSSSSNSNSDPDSDDQGLGHYGIQPWDSFTITSLGLLTRAVSFRTRLGTFQWRYASKREREREREALLSSSMQGNSNNNSNNNNNNNNNNNDLDVASLLVLERVVRVAHAHNDAAGGRGSTSSSSSRRRRSRDKEEEVRMAVAKFVRGAGTRTEGSSRSSAGNGGRLLMDLGLWDSEEERQASGAGGKEEREMAAVMVVTTCLVMLKREVDRRRAQQIAIMAGVLGGGGS